MCVCVGFGGWGGPQGSREPDWLQGPGEGSMQRWGAFRKGMGAAGIQPARILGSNLKEARTC